MSVGVTCWPTAAGCCNSVQMSHYVSLLIRIQSTVLFFDAETCNKTISTNLCKFLIGEHLRPPAVSIICNYMASVCVFLCTTDSALCALHMNGNTLKSVSSKEFCKIKKEDKQAYVKPGTRHSCKLITRVILDNSISLPLGSFYMHVDENWCNHVLQVMGEPGRGEPDL